MSEESFDPLFDRLEGIFAYDRGATDSGIHDENLRAELIAELKTLTPDDDRLRLSRWLREAYLSEEGLKMGYGWEDVVSFVEWLDEQRQ
jgi:hypothetical protein